MPDFEPGALAPAPRPLGLANLARRTSNLLGAGRALSDPRSQACRVAPYPRPLHCIINLGFNPIAADQASFSGQATSPGREAEIDPGHGLTFTCVSGRPNPVAPPHCREGPARVDFEGMPGPVPFGLLHAFALRPQAAGRYGPGATHPQLPDVGPLAWSQGQHHVAQSQERTTFPAGYHAGATSLGRGGTPRPWEPE